MSRAYFTCVVCDVMCVHEGRGMPHHSTYQMGKILEFAAQFGVTQLTELFLLASADVCAQMCVCVCVCCS